MAALAAGLTGVQGLGPLLMPHKMDFKRPVRPISELEQIALEQARLGLEMSQRMASGDGMMQLQVGGQVDNTQQQGADRQGQQQNTGGYQ
jgi:hypothetical protein